MAAVGAVCLGRRWWWWWWAVVISTEEIMHKGIEDGGPEEEQPQGVRT